MFRSFLILLLFSSAISLRAQVAGELHPFTDKNGKQILASLLAVSDDRKTVKIKREDGLEFDLVINVLSLDDQQFIKDSLKSIPVAKTEYRLELDVDKKTVNSESHSYASGSYTLKQHFQTYVIKVRNLSRETLSNAKVEWAIIWDERLDVMEVDGTWTYDRQGGEEENLKALSGETTLSTLPFNQEVVVTTGEVELNEMLYLRDIYHEDISVGVVARIVDERGTVITESRVGSAALEKLSWQEAIGFPAPRVRN